MIIYLKHLSNKNSVLLSLFISLLSTVQQKLCAQNSKLSIKKAVGKNHDDVPPLAIHSDIFENKVKYGVTLVNLIMIYFEFFTIHC